MVGLRHTWPDSRLFDVLVALHDKHLRCVAGKHPRHGQTRDATANDNRPAKERCRRLLFTLQLDAVPLHDISCLCRPRRKPAPVSL
jgi:transposase